MTHQRAVGQYLGRAVFCVIDTELLKGLSPGALAHAMVLFWLSSSRDSALFRSHLRVLVQASPLVIYVAGPGSSTAFDELLQNLDTEEAPEQIMTRNYEGTLPECIEELLKGTWPSEDRFDNWTDYLIVADDANIDAVKRAATAGLRTTCADDRNSHPIEALEGNSSSEMRRPPR